MFEIKTFEQLTKDMIEWTQANTTKIKDFSVGSKIRTIYESVAVITEELYYKVWQGLKSTIEEGIYILYNFSILPALRATGNVTFSRTTPAPQDFLIPIGTVVKTQKTAIRDSIQFETTSNVTLLIGETSVIAPVQAIIEGKVGNVEADKITEFTFKPAGVESVTNIYKFITGRDQETRDERRKRFGEYTLALQKATKSALQYAASVVPGVHKAVAVENPDMKVFYYNNSVDSFADISIYANNPYTSESPVIFPAGISSEDILYIGNNKDKFEMLFMNFQTVAVDIEGIWEYFDGNTWSELVVTDGTNLFTQNGTISFSKPLIWKDNKINDGWAFWIRFRVTSVGGGIVVPTINYIFASPPPGFVDLYIQDIDGNASAGLVDAVAENLPDYRGAGITVNVRSADKILQAISCDIQINTLFDRNLLINKVESFIIDYLNNFTLGDNLYLDQLSSEIRKIEGGRAIISVSVTTPSNNILVGSGEVLRPDLDNIEAVVVN